MRGILCVLPIVVFAAYADGGPTILLVFAMGLLLGKFWWPEGPVSQWLDSERKVRDDVRDV